MLEVLRLIQEIKAMSETLKIVFPAFLQHSIQSTDFMSEMSEILYSVYSGPSPLQGEGYLFGPSAM